MVKKREHFGMQVTSLHYSPVIDFGNEIQSIRHSPQLRMCVIRRSDVTVLGAAHRSSTGPALLAASAAWVIRDQSFAAPIPLLP
jgi:hypothetical protein